MTNESISLFYDHGYHLNKHFCYSNLTIAACSENRDVTTIPLNGSVTRLAEGETVTLSCSVQGITNSKTGLIIWMIENLETGDQRTLLDINGDELPRCIQTSFLPLTNVNKNNIANYSCMYWYIYDDIDYHLDPRSTFFIDVTEGW